MALLTTGSATGTGATPPAPATITAWATGDQIAASDIGSRGVMAIVTNTSGGSLDFRYEDPGFTPAGSSAANGYIAVPVPTGQERWIFIGPNSVNQTTNAVKVGSSGAAVSTFNIKLARY